MKNRVEPTYDDGYYRTRAERYARAASSEPDPGVRSALQATARACLERAARGSEDVSLDVAWKD
jgi:hypothetical protein